MQNGSMKALKAGVCVFEKGTMSVYLFPDHYKSVVVQLIRTTESAFPVPPDADNPEGSTVMTKTPMVLETKTVQVHGVEKTDDIKPAVQKVIDKMKSEAEKVLQSDQRVAGILGDYKSQSGLLNG